MKLPHFQYKAFDVLGNVLDLVDPFFEGNGAGFGSLILITRDVCTWWRDRLNFLDKRSLIDGGRVIMREALIGSLTFNKLRDGSGRFIVSNGKLKAEYIQADQLQVNYANLYNVKVVRGDIDRAAVGRAQIGDLAVDTIRIANQAVTIPASAFALNSVNVGSGSTGNWVTVQTVNINPQGNPVNLAVSGMVHGSSLAGKGDPNSVTVYMRLLRNGSTLVDFGTIYREGAAPDTAVMGYSTSFSFGYRSPSYSGNQKFEFQVRVSFGDAGNCYISRRSLMAFGVRK